MCTNDTGMDHTIIYSSYVTPLRNCDYLRRLTIIGLMQDISDNFMHSHQNDSTQCSQVLPSLWSEAGEVLIDRGQSLDNHIDCLLSIGPSPMFKSEGNPRNPTATFSASNFSSIRSSNSERPTIPTETLLTKAFYCCFVAAEASSDPGRASSATALERLAACVDDNVSTEHVKQFVKRAADHEGNSTPAWEYNRNTVND